MDKIIEEFKKIMNEEKNTDIKNTMDLALFQLQMIRTLLQMRERANNELNKQIESN